MPPKGKLTIDQESKLIEAVRTRNVLFDKRLDGYRKSKDRIWQEIAGELDVEGVTGSDWQNHWRKLREQYLAFRRKLKKPSGSASSRRPYFRFEESMKFLSDSMEEEDTYSNLPDVENQMQDPLAPPDEDPGVIILDPMDNNDNRNGHRSHTKFNSKRKLDSFEEDLLDVLKKEGGQDEFENFGKVVAAKLRTIASKNKRLATETQQRISIEIFNSELEIID